MAGATDDKNNALLEQGSAGKPGVLHRQAAVALSESSLAACETTACHCRASWDKSVGRRPPQTFDFRPTIQDSRHHPLLCSGSAWHHDSSPTPEGRNVWTKSIRKSWSSI